MKKLLVMALAMLLFPAWAKAQFTVSGTVADGRQPLSGASVSLQQSNQATKTNVRGSFSLEKVPRGNYLLSVSFVGYQPLKQQIRVDNNLNLQLVLTPSTHLLSDEVIVRATRANEKSATTYKNITKEEISVRNFGQDLPFILENTPGVVVSSDAGAGVGYTGIRIRGSDATRVNVTVNGIPYNDSESQGSFWVNMPDFASSVDNIQIQRGVGTSTNGAGAFGGSLNIQTSPPSASPYAELNNTFGSFQTWKNTVKVGTGLINDKFSIDARLSRIKSDGFIDRAASDLKSYFTSGAYQGKKDLLRINVFGGAETTYQAWNGIPEARLHGDVAGMEAYIARNWLSEADAAHLLNSGSRTYNSFTYKDQTDNYWQNHYQLLYARQLSESLSFNGALHYTAGKGYYEEYKADQKFSNYGLENLDQNGTLLKRSDLIRRRWLDNDFYGVTYNLTYQPQTNLTFTLGGGYNEYSGLHFGEIIWAQYASNSQKGDRYYNNEGNKSDFNLFGKATFSPAEKLNLFVDLQYRKLHYNIDGTDKNLMMIGIEDQLNFFNPKLGLTYAFNKHSNGYLSFSVANKEPNRDDYVNAQNGAFPQSERLYNGELGYRAKTERFNGGINLYGMFYKDQLVVTGKINDVGESIRQNVPDSYRAGVEVDATYLLSDQWMINANAALSKNKIKNYLDYLYEYDDNGDISNTVINSYDSPDISFSPALVVFGELTYKPLSRLALSLQNKYVSKQYLDNTQAETRKLSAYFVNNIRAGYDFSAWGMKRVNLALLINNVLDRKYESNGYTYSSIYQGIRTTENFYFPQAGINFLLSLNLSF